MSGMTPERRDQECAVVIAALLAGRIDGQQAIASLSALLAAWSEQDRAQAFDAVLAAADDGIEFGPANTILLRRSVTRARAALTTPGRETNGGAE